MFAIVTSDGIIERDYPTKSAALAQVKFKYTPEYRVLSQNTTEFRILENKSRR